MKKVLISVLIWLAGLSSLFAQKKLPDVEVSTLSGQLIHTQDLLRDSIPVIVAFWSTTCKPCIQEFNALTEYWKSWQEEFRFKVIAVSIDDARSFSKVRTYVAGYGWPFYTVIDKNQDLKRALNVHTIPHVFIVDRKGYVVHSRIGYTVGSERQLFEILKGL